LARADARLALPMAPGVSSLNLATAVSGTLFALAVLRERDGR
jgi:tRNA G18 (ribose-2'-O)-methylase SpoU